MRLKLIIAFISVIFALLLMLPSILAFNFYGYTYNVTGSALNGTNITVEVYEFPEGQPPNLTAVYSAIANSLGYFNISGIAENMSYFYKPIIRHFTGGNLDYIGQSLPEFPLFEMLNLGQISFYLKEGGEINITAHNGSGFPLPFFYMVKDTSLGYPIAMNWNNMVNQTTVYVPADRNYSIMIFPNESFPVGYGLNNLTAYSNNHADIAFNISEDLVWVSGYAFFNSTANFDNLTLIAYLHETGGIVYDGDPLPYNMSAWRGDKTDRYNSTTGFYNITLPAAAMGANLMLLATAQNGTDYYGAFRNISLTMGSGDVDNFNFSLQQLAGSSAIINMEDASAPGSRINITTAKAAFNLTNGTIAPNSAHIELEVDYSAYNSSSFTWMTDISESDSGLFNLPLLLADISKINVFSPDLAPRKISKTASDLASQPVTITLTSFSPGEIDPEEVFADLYIDLVRSSQECDIPGYAQSCSLMPAEQNLSEFNPLTVIMGGGRISFVMRKNSNNITVHYVNVDLFASGPPDAVFDSSANSSQSGTTLDEAWRFGSTGPEIYSYVLIAMPYTEASTSQTGLNESATVTVNIPRFYNDNWNVVWQLGINNTSQLPADYADYNTAEYAAYVNGTNVTCNSTDSNLSSGLCYINTAANLIWIKIPHFSGIGPIVSGSMLKANSEACSANAECASGRCLNNVCRPSSYECDSSVDCSTGYRCSGNICVRRSSGGGGTTAAEEEEEEKATVEEAEEAEVVCGDGSCEAGETQANCCADCGCPAGQECKDNVCTLIEIEKEKPKTKLWPFIVIAVIVIAAIAYSLIPRKKG